MTRSSDSSVAYQGAGRELSPAEVAKLSRWATDGLVPDLTVLLDVPAAAGLARAGTPDRLESEPLDFHERVRERFLDLARRGGRRYLVLDGTRPAEEITAAVRTQCEPLLPQTATQLRELEAVRRAEEERRRIAEEVRRLEAARARADAEDAARRREAAEQERLRLERERARQEQERVRQEQVEVEKRRLHAAAEAEEQAQRDRAEAEDRARRAAAEAEADSRSRAAAAAQQASEAETVAAQRASRAAERRRIKQEQRQARDEARARLARRRSGFSEAESSTPTTGSAPSPEETAAMSPPWSRHDEEPTRELSLTDELFGVGFDDDDDDDDEDRTIRLPGVRGRRDDR